MVLEFVGIALAGVASGYGFRGLINRTGKAIAGFVKNVVEPRIASVENRAIALEQKFMAEVAALKAAANVVKQ